MLSNILYRANIWLDKNELTKFFLMLGFVSLSTTNISLGNLFFGMTMMIILCIFVLYRMSMMSGSAVFDRTRYQVPVVGEKLLVTKTFYWDGSFKKFINTSDPSRKPWWYSIAKGKELEVKSIKDISGDWEMTVMDNDGNQVVINYFESKNYWKSKQDIRSERLKKIGI